MKNLLLVSLDCVRADVGLSGQFEVINRLCRDSACFTNTIASAPLTPISHATVLTGLQPYNHGIRHLFKEKLDRKATTIQQVFKGKGYLTKAIVSCPGMNRWYGFAKGFDSYDDEIPLLPDGTDPLLTVDVKNRGLALKRAELVTERAIAWLEKRDKKRPFVLFVHYFDAHWPYNAPEHFGGKNNYEGEIAYTCHYFARLIESLKRENVYEDTTIVCFSDHGEDLDGLYPNDKGGRKLGHPEECGHGCLLYDQTLKVLLIIKDKKMPKGKRIKDQVRLVDVMPTILDLFGFRGPARTDGESLVRLANGKEPGNHGRIRQAYSETFFPDELDRSKADNKRAFPKKSLRISDKYKTIFELGTGRLESYDLQGDPNELRNLMTETGKK